MQPAIIICNLPSNLSKPLFEKILSANNIAWKDVILREAPDAPEPSQEAFVVLKKQKRLEKVLIQLNECEIADRTLQATVADENVIESFRPSKEVSPVKPEKKPETKVSADENVIESFRPSKKVIPAKPEKKPETKVSAIVDGVEIADDTLRIPFHSLGLSEIVQSNIDKLGFEATTPIQALAIPPIMKGSDLIGEAQTGTGKTLAFAIPMIERILPQTVRRLRGLVLAPTRELAIQIKETFDDLLEGTHLRAVVVYGGDHIIDQLIEMHDGMDILIATPGRLLDLRGRGRLRFDCAEIVVLDEADRMLDMGFMPQIKSVFGSFYEHPQTLLFSATIPPELRKLTGVDIVDPVFVKVGYNKLTPLDTVTQSVINVSLDDKWHGLLDILDHEEGPFLIFARTKRDTERLARKLIDHGYPATRIHGDISQADRLKALNAFRMGRYDILVATDVASRGLDIEGIAHVINYDLPMAPEDHLHRIGRTARAGATGKATTFVTNKDRRSLKQFRSVLGQVS
ncbi:MAG: DEAD/DEAH box helicase [Candidatus Omnitrophota bacterium]|jgi:superfamily II DNA/RNA helicase|nr:MAG: DEAD/DEAH box helicase [Candidatus Omnitrophota bacterium]